MKTDIRPDGRKRSFIEQARRAQIIAAAAETVAEVGYAGASLSRIARQAGINKSVISYHFASKDEIFEQMVSEAYARTEEHLRARLAEEDSAAGKIRTWVAAQIEFFSQDRTRFLAVSEIAVNHRTADGSRPFLDHEDGEVAAIGAILAQGQAADEFRDFDPTGAATIISRAVEGVLGAWMVDEETDLAAQTQMLLDFIDHAIRAEQP